MSDTYKYLLKKAAEAEKHPNTSIANKVGVPIFTKEDILRTENPVARLLRYIFVKLELTDVEFKEIMTTYYTNLGHDTNTVNSNRNNIKKDLNKFRMTIARFEEILEILGFHIQDISYTILNPKTGKKEVFQLTDINDFIANKDT